MHVLSTCPLRVASVVWQPRPGAWTLTFVCKATFVLSPGESRLAEVQEEPAPDDRHFGSDETRSLYAGADLVPWKTRADVVLVGHAFAAHRQPARSVATRLNVGELDKRVDVWCDRVFWQDGRLLEGQPFTHMPLVYERASGGTGTANPLGMRSDAAPDAYGSVPIPNLQPAGQVVARRGDAFAPIAYGPIAASWPGRVDKVPPHVVGWSHRGWSARPLPEGLDPAYFNSAPPDQRVASIRADERILLENLHADHARLETRLPGLRPRAHLTTGGQPGEEIDLVADTLWIDTDRGIATVVWRGRFALSHAREEGQIVVSMHAPTARNTAEDPTRLGDLGGEDSGTLQLPQGELAAILGNLRNLNAPALPFKPAPSVWTGLRATPAPSAREAALPEDTGTTYGARLPDREALPFVAKIAQLDLTPMPELEQIGSLTRVVIPAPEAAFHVAATSDEPAEERVADNARPVEARPLIDEYPIERCAAITASIARRRAETAQILDEAQLDAARWAGLTQRWNEAIKEETGRGRTALLNAFDAAYVARLEEERGPVQVEEYARLLVAAERGNVGEVLAELTLPRGAMMRIERVWLARIAEDEGLDKSVRFAVKMAREA